MPLFESHCHRCRQLLGEPFPEVHKWLDEFFGKEPWGSQHRFLRHHQEGISEIRHMWGNRAAYAAETHIRQDLDEEGWPHDKEIPRDSDAYKKSGLW